MKKSEQIFLPYLQSPGFWNDIRYISTLSNEKLLLYLANYLKSKYRYYYFTHINKFESISKITDNKAHIILQIFDFFAYGLIPKYEKKDILQAINELFSNKIALENYETIIDKFKNPEVRDILKILDLIDDEIGNINPHFRNITFNIQNRIVMKDNEIIKEIPIVTIEFNTSKDNDSKNIMELLEEDIDSIINGLSEIKNKIGKMSINNTTNKKV